MKNNFYFFFLLFMNALLFAQEIKYKPIFINQCTNEEEKNVIWDFIDISKGKSIKKDIWDSEVILPQLGEYELIYNLSDVEHIRIDKAETKLDTIFLEKLQIVFYVSHPPIMYFIDCNTNANGKVVDYYSNGFVRAMGTFKNGKLTDSLKKYDSEGAITELEIPNKKGNRLIHYYKNGKIKEDIDYRKKYNKIYSDSGNLIKNDTWKWKYKSISYYENGNIKCSKSNKKQKTFSEQGVLIDKITRKEIYLLLRLLSLNKDDRKARYYEYTWERYDNKGAKKCEIIYRTYISKLTFTDSIEQIDISNIDTITFYKKELPYKKIVSKYIRENNNLKQMLIIYHKENEEWIEEEKIALKEVYSLYEKYIIE